MCVFIEGSGYPSHFEGLNKLNAEIDLGTCTRPALKSVSKLDCSFIRCFFRRTPVLCLFLFAMEVWTLHPPKRTMPVRQLHHAVRHASTIYWDYASPRLQECQQAGLSKQQVVYSCAQRLTYDRHGSSSQGLVQSNCASPINNHCTSCHQRLSALSHST